MVRCLCWLCWCEHCHATTAECCRRDDRAANTLGTKPRARPLAKNIQSDSSDIGSRVNGSRSGQDHSRANRHVYVVELPDVTATQRHVSVATGQRHFRHSILFLDVPGGLNHAWNLRRGCNEGGMALSDTITEYIMDHLIHFHFILLKLTSFQPHQKNYFVF